MLALSGRLVNRPLNDRLQMLTMREMTVLADPPAGRPDVAVVRQPIADDRHTVIGYELLFGGERRSLDSATDAKATSALLVDAFGEADAEFEQARPYLEAFETIVAGGTADDDTVRSRTAVTLK